MSSRLIPGLAKRQSSSSPAVRSGFSLVELLTVVGIIALLIGILMPTLSQARVEARRGASKAFLASCERGLEMFNGDHGKYPDSSRREDALTYTDVDGGGVPTLNGAHWLVRAMIGPDGAGVDYGAKGVFGPQASYAHPVDTTPTDANPKPPLGKRRGLYVEGAKYVKDNQFYDDPNNGSDRTVFLDKFDFPVLYYRAQPRAQLPCCLVKGENGVYVHEDNVDITGLAGDGGWDLISDPSKRHGLSVLGDPNVPNQRASDAPDGSSGHQGLTFVGYIYDRSAFDSDSATGPKKVVRKVMKDTSFILIAPGPDGMYGTTDDLSNLR